MNDDKNKELIESTTRSLYLILGYLPPQFGNRTAMGLVLGGLLYVLSQLFAPLLKGLTWLDVSALSFTNCLVIGLGILYIPMILRYMFKFSIIGDDLDIPLAIIKKAERAGLPQKAVRQLYLDLAAMTLKNMVLKPEVKKELAAVEQEQKAAE